MPQTLINISNMLFYNYEITTRYIMEGSPVFLSREAPLLFIDCKSPEDQLGTSFYN